MIHYDLVKKFIVTRLEVYEQLVEVEATSVEKAVLAVQADDGIITCDPTFHSFFNSANWSVEEIK
jgi:hypothetical protein